MKELAKVLPTWQTERRKCIGSVPYSDIGKKFYPELGWHPFPNNNHIHFDPMIALKSPQAKILVAEDLDQLCKEDEAMIQKTMANTSNRRTRMVLVPDHNHMLWHHRKEEFVCNRLFGKQPRVKGAIAGQPGNRVWAIWTHRFYGDPESATSENTLYILRLVIENQIADAPWIDLQAKQLKAILQIAQAEAAEWNLRSGVKLWDPSPLAQKFIERTEIPHQRVEREHESIASLLWYGGGSGKEDVVEWVANEKYAWC